MLNRYYHTYWVQGLVEVAPSWPPGWGPPTDWQWGDKHEIQGLFVQNQSTEVQIAGTTGITEIGRFACHVSEDVRERDTLRAEDGTLFRLKSIPFEAPMQSPTQVKTFLCEKADREEETARLRKEENHPEIIPMEDYYGKQN